MNKIKFFFLLLLFLVNTKISYAYLDPGTGSYILQILALILASVGTFFGFFFNKVKQILKKILNFFKFIKIKLKKDKN
jgi:hypothetical protein